LDFDASVDDVEQLALQFLEGVEYLQRSSVAHLDLKPDNIVVQRDPESQKVDLTIIDFNNAVLAGAESTISAPRGTSGWCAPEVAAEKPYNPLLADRWSCGSVLAFFTKRMKRNWMQERMDLLSRRLMDPNPSLRPSVDVARLRQRPPKPPIRPSTRYRYRMPMSRRDKPHKLWGEESSLGNGAHLLPLT
jgi:serine/threonine protein kinase